ncbi:MAG: hypothetical protein Q8Q14_00515 [Gemmatimonadales bacterium]|nr:hypothetical protein [Gemmatimonadales bacterium]
MALRFYPDARTLVDVVCVCDPAVAAANTSEALQRYRASGDLSEIVVPDDASRFTIRPLNGQAPGRATAEAGVLGKPVHDVLDRIRTGEADVDRLTPEDEALFERFMVWRGRRAYNLCRYGIERVSDFPGVTAAAVGGLRCYPTEHLDRVPDEARQEIADHLDRIGSAAPEGKACSGGRSGAPPGTPVP